MLYKSLFLLVFANMFNQAYRLQEINCPKWVPGTNQVMPARINQAKISAASGLSHFIALELDYVTLRQQAGDLESIQAIPRTQLGDKTFYEVNVHFCCGLSAGQYIVESTGYYMKGDKIISSKSSRSLFISSQTN